MKSAQGAQYCSGHEEDHAPRNEGGHPGVPEGPEEGCPVVDTFDSPLSQSQDWTGTPRLNEAANVYRVNQAVLEPPWSMVKLDRRPRPPDGSTYRKSTGPTRAARESCERSAEG